MLGLGLSAVLYLYSHAYLYSFLESGTWQQVRREGSPDVSHFRYKASLAGGVYITEQTSGIASNKHISLRSPPASNFSATCVTASRLPYINHFSASEMTVQRKIRSPMPHPSHTITMVLRAGRRNPSPGISQAPTSRSIKARKPPQSSLPGHTPC